MVKFVDVTELFVHPGQSHDPLQVEVLEDSQEDFWRKTRES